MKEFVVTVLSVDVDHCRGSRHDDPRHGTKIKSVLKNTPASLNTFADPCEITETPNGDLLIRVSGQKKVLQKGETFYINSGLKIASDQAQYYEITF